MFINTKDWFSQERHVDIDASRKCLCLSTFAQPSTGLNNGAQRHKWDLASTLKGFTDQIPFGKTFLVAH